LILDEAIAFSKKHLIQTQQSTLGSNQDVPNVDSVSGRTPNLSPSDTSGDSLALQDDLGGERLAVGDCGRGEERSHRILLKNSFLVLIDLTKISNFI
jgi:hypothetical protein